MCMTDAAVISTWSHMLMRLTILRLSLHRCTSVCSLGLYTTRFNMKLNYDNSSIRAQVALLLAGVYVGFGSFLAFTVGANLQEMAISNPGLQKFLYGAIGLPAGLVMVSNSVPNKLYQSYRLLLQNREHLFIAAAITPAAHSSAKASLQPISVNCLRPKMLVRHV